MRQRRLAALLVVCIAASWASTLDTSPKKHTMHTHTTRARGLCLAGKILELRMRGGSSNRNEGERYTLADGSLPLKLSLDGDDDLEWKLSPLQVPKPQEDAASLADALASAQNLSRRGTPAEKKQQNKRPDAADVPSSPLPRRSDRLGRVAREEQERMKMILGEDQYGNILDPSQGTGTLSRSQAGALAMQVKMLKGENILSAKKKVDDDNFSSQLPEPSPSNRRNQLREALNSPASLRNSRSPREILSSMPKLSPSPQSTFTTPRNVQVQGIRSAERTPTTPRIVDGQDQGTRIRAGGVGAASSFEPATPATPRTPHMADMQSSFGLGTQTSLGLGTDVESEFELTEASGPVTPKKVRQKQREQELMHLLESLDSNRPWGSGRGSIGTSAGKEGELLGEELERAGREQEKEEEEENLLQELEDDEDEIAGEDQVQPDDVVRGAKEHFKRQKELYEYERKIYESEALDESDAWSQQDDEESSLKKVDSEVRQSKEGRSKGGMTYAESLLDSELIDWESMPEEVLRKHVKKVLETDYQPRIGGERSLHPRWYELMCVEVDIDPEQCALNVELRDAIKDGDVDEVKKVIAEGADVQQRMPDYWVPEDEDYDAVVLCLIWPPLHWAACTNQPDVMSLLVEHGADLNAVDGESNKGRYAHDIFKDDAQTPLTDQESRKEFKVQHNMTALHWATFHHNPECVKLLCELGADVLMEDVRNRTAIEIAAYQRHHPEYQKEYDECLQHLKKRLIEQVGDMWPNWWPQLLNETYLEAHKFPAGQDPRYWPEELRKELMIADYAYLLEERLDLDEILKKARASDDPTIRKNEYYHMTVRNPEEQLVQPYVPGIPFILN